MFLQIIKKLIIVQPILPMEQRRLVKNKNIYAKNPKKHLMLLVINLTFQKIIKELINA